MATAINVNLFLPLLAIVLGLAHRRLVFACFGAVGMTVAFVLGRAFVYPPPQPWDAATLPEVVIMADTGIPVPDDFDEKLRLELHAKVQAKYHSKVPEEIWGHFNCRKQSTT